MIKFAIKKKIQINKILDKIIDPPTPQRTAFTELRKLLKQTLIARTISNLSRGLGVTLTQ